MSDRTAFLAATRSSPLARWQTTEVTALLSKALSVAGAGSGAVSGGVESGGVESGGTPVVSPVFVETLGDRTQALGTPLHQIGGQGVFVKEVQAAVLRGDADFAVHSCKDLPSAPTPGLVLAAFPERGLVSDVLIGNRLADLRSGAVIGTGSVRRRAQLAAVRPDLQFAELRGNVGRRIERAGEFDAIVLAQVPLLRLGLTPDVVEVLPSEIMLPMVGQGALAVECREDDIEVIRALSMIDHPATRVRVIAERTFLARLGTGCSLPVAALAKVSGDGSADGGHIPGESLASGSGEPWVITLEGLVASLDGSTIVRRTVSGSDPIAVGNELADLVLGAGGADLLAAIG